MERSGQIDSVRPPVFLRNFGPIGESNLGTFSKMAPKSNSKADTLPIYQSLEEVYNESSLLAQGERWNSLTAEFKTIYGHLPQFIARAPGRVNIIGEHIGR